MQIFQNRHGELMYLAVLPRKVFGSSSFFLCVARVRLAAAILLSFIFAIRNIKPMVAAQKQTNKQKKKKKRNHSQTGMV